MKLINFTALLTLAFASGPGHGVFVVGQLMGNDDAAASSSSSSSRAHKLPSLRSSVRNAIHKSSLSSSSLSSNSSSVPDKAVEEQVHRKLQLILQTACEGSSCSGLGECEGDCDDDSMCA
eukprot:CAMPEP_0183766076 /NCGR_PEP_ID=MMETSP0739-20130205/11327_1 /TAXON_ID=385413 /ORGANISM="Thalassiosira miniscula, Strain CCMP1093" /LENGTH=119 /DNA_ID=CAMNT_0026004815 /DNA_START=195 /DNA_END=550 /DNA_ORIENTATION=+